MHGQHASANKALQDSFSRHDKPDNSSSIGPMCKWEVPTRQPVLNEKPNELPAYGIMRGRMHGNDNYSRSSLKESVSKFAAPKPEAHLKNQSKLQQEEHEFCKSDGRPITTLMMTNIPCHLDVSDLALIIEEAGFQDCYDVLYLPKRGGSLHNMGFAVLNFNTSALANRFKCTFSKGLTMSVACVQGFTEILKLVKVSGLLVRV